MSILCPALSKLVFKRVQRCVGVDQGIEIRHTLVVLITMASTGRRNGIAFVLRAKTVVFTQSLGRTSTPRSIVCVERTPLAIESYSILNHNTFYLSYYLCRTKSRLGKMTM